MGDAMLSLEERANLAKAAMADEPTSPEIQRLRELLALIREPATGGGWTNHRDVDWQDKHTQYSKHDRYSVR